MEFYLDLNKSNLYGWEGTKSFDKIAKMINSIEQEDCSFPAVPVTKIDNFSYSLVLDVERIDCPFMEDGGHHRAIAHYIANAPLKCRIPDEKITIPKNRISIKNISLYF